MCVSNCQSTKEEAGDAPQVYQLPKDAIYQDERCIFFLCQAFVFEKMNKRNIIADQINQMSNISTSPTSRRPISLYIQVIAVDLQLEHFKMANDSGTT